MKEKLFWIFIAVSSACAAFYGYERFKLIRPDLFEDKKDKALKEAERAARIADYQKKGDALSRAAAITRKPKANESCVDGILVESVADAAKPTTRAVVANGQPVHCETGNAAPAH